MSLLSILEHSKLGQGSKLARVVNKAVSFTSNQGVDTDFIRVSSLYYMCPRQFVLNYWRPSPSYNVFTPDAMFKMQIGTDLHSYLQDKVLGPAGVLWGIWKNKETGAMRCGDFHPEPLETFKQLQNGARDVNWTFVEPSFHDGKYRLKGHCDGRLSKARMNAFLGIDDIRGIKEVLSVEPGPLCQIEIKTTTDLYKIAGVPPWYKMQSSVYQWFDNMDESMFLFLDRADCQIKTLNYEFEQAMVDEGLQKCKLIWESIRDEVIPDGFMKCKKSTDKRAKTCSHATECWGKQDWKKWIEESKKIGKEKGRRFLDLSGLTFG